MVKRLLNYNPRQSNSANIGGKTARFLIGLPPSHLDPISDEEIDEFLNRQFKEFTIPEILWNSSLLFWGLWGEGQRERLLDKVYKTLRIRKALVRGVFRHNITIAREKGVLR
ncbi:hypothetical protein IQ249_22275 [Lusitaniella coriacea LEGE 07157]|uniref:Uncharacterized protein n=1 Tax=Lusitaniella coriacea LEGE 07157 TaxID=945747 RepID=A0A8J7JF99_9CYAN|nr:MULTISPECIES: hypothetical protein [Cyanophyceae]MBE9097842.1 hypothetical protein [Tychonema sp. LEGE 07203]MBE9118620.1 hypothetical protein [Lusitaniella coriacea LEGE 07157]